MAAGNTAVTCVADSVSTVVNTIVMLPRDLGFNSKIIKLHWN